MAKPPAHERSAELVQLVIEGQRVVTGWDDGESDDATDAVRGQSDPAELVGELERVCKEASEILADIYGED